MLKIGGFLVGVVLLAACAPAVSSSPPPAALPPQCATAPHTLPPVVPNYSGSDAHSILVAGDSTAYGIDTNLRNEMAARGYPAIINLDWNGSTGFAGSGPPPLPQVDWVARMQTDLATYHPDIVVLAFVGSFDANPPTDTIARGTQLVDLIHASGAKVAFTLHAAINDPNTAYRAIVDPAIFALPADWHPDWNATISPGSSYSEYGITDRGCEQLRPDVIHLTAAAQRVAALVTLDAIRTAWRA